MLKYRQNSNNSDIVEREIDYIIKEGKTNYQNYLFFHSKTNGTCIAIDGDIQSCQRDEAIYHEALVHVAMLCHENPKNVLIMGGGEGATAREVLKHNETIDRVVMIDIDKEFVKVCQNFAPTWSDGAFKDKKLEVYYMDIKEYLANCNLKFDVVIGDLVDVDNWDGFLATLYNQEFYTNLKKVLNKNAFVATQGGGLDTIKNQNHKNIKQSLSSVFLHVDTYAVVVPSFYGLWGYVLASDNKFDTSMFQKRLNERNIDLKAIGNENLKSLFNIPKMIEDSYS